MTKMSIGAAFSETFAFLKANWMQMLIWMGGALLVVGLLGYLLLGSTFSAMALAPNDPSLVMGAFGKIALFALVAAVIFYGVSMLIWRGGMYPGEAPNFAWAFQAGPALAFGMFVVMIAAYIVIFIIMFVLTLIFGAALGGMGAFSPAALESGGAGAIGGGAIFLMIILYVAMIVFLLWVQGRFLVAGPVMANQLTRNPVTGLGESWRLTGPSQWTIVGFYLLFTIGIFIYAMIAGLIFGGVLGAILGGSAVGAILTMIVMAAVVYLPVIMISFSMPVGVYRALSPRASGDVFA
ncbi:hypothetical protein ATE68_04010 [Sphingopyxis sp. H038]|uniref:hypothetical protein n=1 Tax=unclassified Sphingopyxis TaxID=2614943 RepID=UPI0007318317|nr:MULTISPECIES: hypothetical protein [unclassified Sphingopyxis]KTE03061.1 hypothetical protein ATE78_07085 [Sphingopyxis sp. H012]KTE10439.1 hypothetical protein ATE70_11330 [Sphingopyxis sp. H053]KTE14634.1 hypothetical protein ATE76_07475 [Sphingopyxis sp. H093]KTE29045.1 hypothetical protein ATE75_09600 [Sphingopyxis sp. H080]KTE36043.1 hypothetical protein ATE68_04010 [Sphingopyxis sp. H038]